MRALSHLFGDAAFRAAVTYCRSQLLEEEREALEGVRICLAQRWKGDSPLRGLFVGDQAERDPVLEDRIRLGTKARGEIFVFLERHTKELANLPADLAETLFHEIDHALGLDESGVLDRAARRGRLDSLTVTAALFRPAAPPRASRRKRPAVSLG